MAVDQGASGLTGGEIMRVVSTYIGVSGGYLNGFSYRELSEFYPVYCDLDVDPFEFQGNTTRERFISVLRESSPRDQARILRGLLEKMPVPIAQGSTVMTREDVTAMISRLQGLPVPESLPQNASDTVMRALADGQYLLEQGRPSSAVDRVHTALHGYLRILCDEAGITYAPGDSVQRLLRLLRENHPNLRGIAVGTDEISRIMMSLGTVAEAVNTLRNTMSLAHPNDDLLGESEAVLVINAVRAILHYLERKRSAN